MIVFADVSQYQSVNWGEYAKHYPIVGIKATEGQDYTDPKFYHNYAGSRNVQSRIFYHFARFCQPGRKPEAEADHFTGTIKHAGGLGRYDTVACDLEWKSNGYPGLLARTQYARFCKRVRQNLGIDRIGNYTGQWFWGPLLGSWIGVDEWGWISAYVDFNSFEKYVPRSFKGHVLIHQHSDGRYGPAPHTAHGIGSCDMNRLTVANKDAYFRAIHRPAHPHPTPKPPSRPAAPTKPPKYPGFVLGPNDKHHDLVKLVQRRLRVKDDGIFGKQTIAAIKLFKKRRKLKGKIDGYIGPTTWRELFH